MSNEQPVVPHVKQVTGALNFKSKTRFVEIKEVSSKERVTGTSGAGN